MDAILLQEIELARAMTGPEKMLAGLQLYDQFCEELLSRIKEHFCEMSDDDARAVRRVILDTIRKRNDI